MTTKKMTELTLEWHRLTAIVDRGEEAKRKRSELNELIFQHCELTGTKLPNDLLARHKTSYKINLTNLEVLKELKPGIYNKIIKLKPSVNVDGMNDLTNEESSSLGSFDCISRSDLSYIQRKSTKKGML